MSTQVVACYNCKRLLAEWVVTSKLTMNHRGKNYCRFCYAELRFSGELDTAKDDSALLATVVRESMHKKLPPEELRRKAQPNFSRKTEKPKLQQIPPPKVRIIGSTCPTCKTPFKVRLTTDKPVVGRCKQCQGYLSISPNKVAPLSIREHMVMSISQRSGQSPNLVEQMLGYFFDEMSAQLAERNSVELPGLGLFRVYCSSIGPNVHASNLEVTFRPGKKLLERISERRSR